MNNRTLLLLWVIVIALALWLLWFGISDFWNIRTAAEDIDRNPMRPIFRLAFGLLMSCGIIFTGALISARKGRR